MASALQERINALMKAKHEREKRLQEELEQIKEQKEKTEKQFNNEMEETLRTLREEDEENFKKEQEKKTRENQVPLEQTVEEEAPKQTQSTNELYSTNKTTDANIADFTNPDVYNNIKEILDTPVNYRTQAEKNLLGEVRYNLNKIQEQEARNINEQDPNSYVARTQNLISSFYK